jgi:protein tyrosine/serine phosphatase
MRPQALLTLATWLLGCAGQSPHSRSTAMARQPGAADDPLQALSSPSGPLRFARVSARLYRGGQPSADHLLQLRALGVRTVIDLRGEDPAARSAEEAAADRLGLTFYSVPFSGTRTPDEALLRRIVATMADGQDGAVYVHCQRGRDRTSLAVALYRVWIDGWAPERAWQLEARDYGYRGWLFLRPLERAFRRLTRVSTV